MLKRYTPLEPNGISIVYLRGSKRRIERGSKWRYEHVSVYCFTEDLPESRRKYYEDKLDEIARKAEVGAVANDGAFSIGATAGHQAVANRINTKG
jgi:hypothetical protein